MIYLQMVERSDDGGGHPTLGGGHPTFRMVYAAVDPSEVRAIIAVSHPVHVEGAEKSQSLVCLMQFRGSDTGYLVLGSVRYVARALGLVGGQSANNKRTVPDEAVSE